MIFFPLIYFSFLLPQEFYFSGGVVGGGWGGIWSVCVRAGAIFKTLHMSFLQGKC